MIRPSEYIRSTVSHISSIAVLSLGDSHNGWVRPTETLRVALASRAFASCASVPWAGHMSLSSASRMSHSQGQSQPDEVLNVHIVLSFRPPRSCNRGFFYGTGSRPLDKRRIPKNRVLSLEASSQCFWGFSTTKPYFGWVSLDIRGTVLTVQSPKVSPAQWQVDPT